MIASDVPWQEVQSKAASVFGARAFRPGQRELLEAVFEGRDALGVLPTGGGKSLCFQLASLFLPRPVVVVTPLISLSEDQTDKLDARHVAAVRIDSTLRAGEERSALAGVRGGKLELVYVTPERLARPAFVDALREAGVSLLVVDEAHCISQWGHDFRPAFLALRQAALALGRPPVLALTATATPAVERDIVEQLALRAPRLVRIGCDRPNIRLAVRTFDTEEDKRLALRTELAAERGSAIVYTATVRAAKEVWGALVEAGLAAGLYHGQLPTAVRDTTQDAFMDDRYRVMVATKAFGMGIDKPDTRLVVHHQLSDSIESYYQEVGRAGRNGLPARAILLYRAADRRVQQYFLLGKYPRASHVDELVARLRALSPGGAIELGVRGGHVARLVEVMLADLEQHGAVRCDAGTWRIAEGARLVTARDVLTQRYQQRAHEDRARLDALVAYAEQATCRTATVRRYFGEVPDARCAHCDNCGAG